MPPLNQSISLLTPAVVVALSDQMKLLFVPFGVPGLNTCVDVPKYAAYVAGPVVAVSPLRPTMALQLVAVEFGVTVP